MRSTGIRELKNKLSHYLRFVRAGETVLVTDRGRVIAELRPPGGPELPAKYPVLRELVREGQVREGAPNQADLYPRLDPALDGCTAAELLDEERGPR